MTSQRRSELLWTEQVVRKIFFKHHVAIEEVQEAFEDPRAVITRGRYETRLVYGKTESGRHLLIVTRPEGIAVSWLVTARDMTRREKARYASR